MASMQETKRRRTSVIKTKKITKAMQLVATAKIRRAKNNLNDIQEYYNSVYNTFQDLLTNVDDISKIFPDNPKEKAAHILITSDLGLCGGYNTNILKLFKKAYKEGDIVMVIGSKGVSHLNAKYIPIDCSYSNTGDKLEYTIAESIATELINLFINNKLSKVNLFYTKFVNSVTFEPTRTQLLPIDPSDISLKKVTSKAKMKVLTSFEPSAAVVIKQSIPLYISALIFGTAIESKLSEMSARRTAMENATDNADELIEKLNLAYNRARQAKITQEIAEIVSGAEST